MSLYKSLERRAQTQPDKVAIDSEAGELTYGQLKALVDRCDTWFRYSGLNPGDRVAILALNHPDWFITVFAAAKYGVVLVPLNWRLSIDELRYVMSDCTPVMLLHDSDFSDTAQQLQSADESVQRVQIGTCHFPPPSSDNVQSIHADSGDTDPLLIVYTSGTTGRPKGAVLSQRNLKCSSEMTQHMVDLTSSDRVLNVLPLFHVGGLNIQPLPALLCGATLVLQSRFDADSAAKALAEKEITLVNSVPTLLNAVLDSVEWNVERYESLRAISIGSTDVPVSLISRVHQFGIPLIQVYGATETSPVAIYQRIEDSDLVGSIGRSGLHCEIRLTDNQGQVVASGEAGEIEVKGDNVLSHYWCNESATRKSLNDGWFKTGDIAHQDEDGYYWFDDRLKHVIISGGENIYPAELERVIREVPGVQELAVVGMPDERWGEVPVAVIVGSVDKQDVLNACTRLARFKQPRNVIFLDSLPKNALGKVQVAQLKTQLLSTCQ